MHVATRQKWVIYKPDYTVVFYIQAPLVNVADACQIRQIKCQCVGQI